MQELKILSIPNLYKLRVCSEMHEYIHHLEEKNRPEHDHNYVSKTAVQCIVTPHATLRSATIMSRMTWNTTQDNSRTYGTDYPYGSEI